MKIYCNFDKPILIHFHRWHLLAQPTGFLAFVPVWGVAQGVAVVELIVASIGLVRSHSLAESTALLAVLLVSVASITGKLTAVGIFVQARLFRGHRGIRWSGYLLTLHGSNDFLNIAHVDSTVFQLHVSLLTPVLPPGVLDEPVILSTLCSIANYCYGMVGSITPPTPIKDTSFVGVEFTANIQCAKNSPLLRNQLFERIFILIRPCVELISKLGSSFMWSHIAITIPASTFIKVIWLVSQLPIFFLYPLEVCSITCSVTTTGPKLIITTVNELLFGKIIVKIPILMIINW